MHPTADTHSARYFALLYSSAPEQPVLEALFGIERELLDSLRPGIDHHVAHSRLQWWREECERTASGEPVHPLTRSLVTALGGASIAQSKLLGLSGFVDVAAWDLASATFETRRELTAYCERWATAMINPLVALGSGLAKPSTNWLAVGAAMREIEMLADVAREAHRGRLRIPLDELQSIGAEPSTLAKPPWPAAVTNLLRARHKTQRDEIARALGNVDREQQPTLRGLLVWAALVSRSSRRVERALPERFHPGRLGAISDAFFSWRIARSATVGRFDPR